MTTSFDPDALLTALRLADRLEVMPRMGWIVSRVPQPESVAAHSYGVCLTAMLLMDAVAQRTPPPPMDRARVLEIAIVHDLAEALTTDIPAPVKRRIGKAVIHEVERAATAELLAGVDPRYVALWEEYAEGQTLEARVVKAADKVQMMVKVLQYERTGQGDLSRFWKHASNLDDCGVAEARVLFDRVLAHHEAGSWPGEDL